MKSTYLSNLHHFCAQTDGSYNFPNTQEGDLLKTAKLEIEELMQGVGRLAKAIHSAELQYKDACYYSSTASQVSASSKIDSLKGALAIVSGHEVGSKAFNAILEAHR